MSGSTALVVIDPYNDFISEGGKLWPYAREVAERVGLVPNLKRLVEAAREAEIQIVFAPHHRFDEGDFEAFRFVNPTHAGAVRVRPFTRGTWGAEFHPDFTVQRSDVVVQEHWMHSAFAGTDLDYQLRMRGIDRIAICGMRTNACVEATARWGVELGYHVTIVKDATAAFSWEEWVATIETNARGYAHAIVATPEAIAAWKANAAV